MSAAVETIVVGHDGSSGGDEAVAWVAGLAAQAGAQVRLVHVFEPLVAMEHAKPPVDFHQLREQTRVTAETVWAAPLEAAGVTWQVDVQEGKPVEVLVEAARAPGVGLVVIGSHGHKGWSERILGSVVTKLGARLPVPLAVVPHPKP